MQCISCGSGISARKEKLRDCLYDQGAVIIALQLSMSVRVHATQSSCNSVCMPSLGPFRPASEAQSHHVQASKAVKAPHSLGALLQRLLCLLSHPDEAAPLLESQGLPQASLITRAGQRQMYS